MAKKKITRKELLKEPDEFFTLTGKVMNWVQMNPKPLIIGGSTLVAILLVIAGYGYYQSNRARVAGDLLGQSLSRYGQAVDQADAVQALETVGPDFERLIDKFGSQPAGKLGCLLYAHYALMGEKPQKAVELYQQALKAYHQDPAIMPIILNGLASALQQTGDAEAAIRAYEKIVALESNTYKDNALFQLGRLYSQSGQAEKGRAMFDRLVTDFPSSSHVQIAREKMLDASQSG